MSEEYKWKEKLTPVQIRNHVRKVAQMEQEQIDFRKQLQWDIAILIRDARVELGTGQVMSHGDQRYADKILSLFGM